MLVGTATAVRTPANPLSRPKYLRISEIVDEYRGAFAQSQDGVGLNLGVWRQDSLSKPRYDGLGQIQVLVSSQSRKSEPPKESKSGPPTSMVRASFSRSFLSEEACVDPAA